MSDLGLLRREFERHMIKTNSVEQFSGCLPEQVERFEARLNKNLVTVGLNSLSEQGRRLNNFCIGSDPEFVFYQVGAKNKYRAADLGLLPGLACGCDQNQRLAELRGWPTTSVVTHVAGILSSLRWMYRAYPNVRQVQWRAGAWQDGDGIGGHVHFGRKQPTRKEEVLALDGVASLFRALGILDNNGWNRRLQPDAHNQIYGFYGDFRKQLHGYEYRAMPSWLCDPVKAFVVLTVSKLAVLDPELTRDWIARPEVIETGLGALRRLSSYFAGRDDDAWLLKQVLLQPGFSTKIANWQRVNLDFRGIWGMPFEPYECRPLGKCILPAVIAPAAIEIKEIGDLLCSGLPLKFQEVEPTFQATIPSRYVWLYGHVFDGIQYAGAGDLMHNLVGSKDCPFRVLFHRNSMQISKFLVDSWSVEIRKRFMQEFPKCLISPSLDHDCVVFQRDQMGVASIAGVRDFLLNWGSFPLWTVNTVKESSYNDWRAKVRPVKARKVNKFHAL